MKTNSTVKVSDLFNVGYGTKLDFKQMKIAGAFDVESVLFVSRSSNNLGVVARVEKYRDVNPIPAGSITVALGGTYLLSAFIQEEPFYTAQNVAVLTSKSEMTYGAKLFYCLCLGKNRFKYSAFGREANRTLGNILVPAEIPAQFSSMSLDDVIPSKTQVIDKHLELCVADWKYYRLSDLFEISGSKTTPLLKLRGHSEGLYPYVTTQATNIGVAGFYNYFTENGNILAVDSAVLGYCSYQSFNFSASDHVEKLIPKFNMNPYIAMFLTTIMNLEQYRYSYGRKASQERLRKARIKLPSKGANPDWQFMEDYIKTLPYSSNL